MNLLFDLDGTLTDPFPGITRCIIHALDCLGRPSPSPEDLRWCIGPPLKKSLATLLGSSDDGLAEQALAKYRERFSSIGLYENEVYPGMAASLHGLSAFGHTLYVATSKPTIYAERILVHLGLDGFFRDIYGSELDGTHSDKTSLISQVLRQESIVPSDALMIGDREHDMIGARNNGVRSLGVLWGYGTPEELRQAGAQALVACPADLPSVVDRLVKQAE